MTQHFYTQFDKTEFQSEVRHNLKMLYGKTLDTANPTQIYAAVSNAVKELVIERWMQTIKNCYDNHTKQVYYMSMEFLMGRFLGNNLINLGIMDGVKEALDEMGISLDAVEDAEPDPGLGNGGLGRLAACFLDSLTTLDMPAVGCGIRYRNGIFKQVINDRGEQEEIPDDWLPGGATPWEIVRPEWSFEIKFGGTVKYVHKGNDSYDFVQENYSSVMAVAHDIPITGYGTDMVNTLRLWDAEAVHKFDIAEFNAGNYRKAVEQDYLAKTIVEVLYPADDHISGKELRLKQQYFFVSATIQQAIKEFKMLGNTDFAQFPDKYAFQLNDTHPSMAVAELMRLLTDQEGLGWEEAWEITKRTCAYTNHTIMSEALEKWPIDLFRRLLPRIYMIIEEINRRFIEELYNVHHFSYEKVCGMAILNNNMIHMAKLAIVGSHSVNGVAFLHTEILKNQELKDFYEIFPEKFNNKTNGITQRRWLLYSNPELSVLISEIIGRGWITNLDDLKKLVPLAEDEGFCRRCADIKRDNKLKLIEYVKNEVGVELDPESIFDVQVKRLHEYKRQLLNVLHIISLYHAIKENPDYPMHPRSFIFAAKAAAGYRRAKQIIRLINCVANVVNNDPVVSKKMKVVFLPNYRVSLAEKLFPASDVSEQISTAGKEASGTGCMKFILNGAVTLGTMDGANVEICEEVGRENMFIFGLSVEDILKIRAENSYRPIDEYHNNPKLHKVMNSLVDGTFSNGDTEMFREIFNSLVYGGDEYFVLKDFDSYCDAQARVDEAYGDKTKWYRMSVMNIACSGKFSSDRTILEYNRDIWHLI